MKTLCLDTAHKHLVIVLIEQGMIKAAYEQECWKHQSETLFPALTHCMDEASWQSEDIDQVVITDGPGSYTGVRIAMSVAKVFCTTMNKPLYCVTTCQLYAGLRPHCYVMLDARGQRAYFAHYHEGSLIDPEQVLPLSEIEALANHHEGTWVGDCDLINRVSEPLHLAQNFCAVLPLARRIEDIHALTPRYLKDSAAYRVNK